VISASIQAQKNAPAAASIQIPANDYAMDLRPRTLVHLFFRDLYNGAPPENQVSVQGPGVRVTEREQGVDPDLRAVLAPTRFEQSEQQELIDLENDNYRLCFVGEVMGLQFSKSPATRSIILQCADLTSYWDIAFQYQVSGFSLGGGGIRAAFTGASTTVFSNLFLEGSGDIIVNELMSRPPRSYPSLGGTLLGALVHIIEAIGGVYFGPRAVRGTNDFFSLAEMRLHLTQMVGANPFPERDELRLMRARGFGSLFRRSLAGLGKLVSIRAVLTALQRYIFHEHVPITTPRYLPPLTDPNLPRYETVPLSADPTTQPILQAAQQVRTRALELKQRQERSTTPEAARRESGRRGGLGQELTRLVQICSRAARRARQVGVREGNLYDFFGLPTVVAAFQAATNQFQTIQQLCQRGQRRGAGAEFRPADDPIAQQVVSYLDTVAESMSEVQNTERHRRVQLRVGQPDPPPRLMATVYRPDVWMVAPPRCNVIFPELYSEFSYGRDFNAEVSRLLLRTHSAFMGSDIFFDGWFMAPSRLIGMRTGRNQARGRTNQHPDLADAPAMVARDLMEHELYTGIIPAFERMSDLNLNALRGRFANTDNGGRIPYAALAANHIFFQYRFRSRQLNCSGKFNPYVAFGFPCVIIDKYLPRDHLRDGEYDAFVARQLATAVREGEGEIGPPSPERQRIAEANEARVREVTAGLMERRENTHFLGTPESINHSISVDAGGSTQLQMGYARTTNERTEFLGDNVQRAGRVRRVRNRRVVHQVAALEPPQVGTRGPRNGEIREVEEITDRYQPSGRRLRSTNRTATGQARFRGGTLLPLFVQDQAFIRSGRRRGTRVLVGVEQPAASYGPEVVALVGTGGRTQSAVADSSQTTVTFRAFRVVEEVGIYRSEDVVIPPEELVFPPWYGEHYKSNNIGGLYSYLFGIGAITDPLTILAPGVDPQQFNTQPAPPTPTPAAPTREQRTRDLALRLSQRMAQLVSQTVRDIETARSPPQPAAGASEEPAVASDEAEGPPGDPADAEVDGILAQIQTRSPIAQALDEVVRAYSLVKLNGYDTHQFLRAYTWRPIATMVDLFGTANLEIDDRGEVVRGREGFHSRAFGDYDDLRTLIGPGEGGRPQTILGLTTAEPDQSSDRRRAERDQAISARLDTRKEKRLQVLRYLNALMNQRGLLA